ncbi:MAG: hypothetical protein PWP04_824 [Candidatus Atribacteria bacterium]|nr:hypothetical protein [Candidatus Atribacteria bacterium]
MGQFLLGVDLGTSNVKAVLFDTQGRVVSSSSRELAIISKRPSEAEQDMEEVWQETAQAIAQCIATSGKRPTDIAALGVTGQGTGCWLLDANLQPLDRAVIWIDGRAAEMIDEWKADGRHDQVFKLSSNCLFTGSPLAILAWLKKYRPKVLDKAKHLVFAKDWIKFKLTGAIVTDSSDLFMFPQSITGEILPLLEIFDLSGLEKIIPPLESAFTVVGKVGKEAAAVTGLAVDTPVVNGVVDVASCAIALGVLEFGQVYSILGTTCFNAFLSERSSQLFAPPGVGITVSYPLQGAYLRAMGTMAGTLSLDWFIARFLTDQRKTYPERSSFFSFLEEEAQKIPPGSEGVVFLPYISPGGERAPFINPHAQGLFFGLRYNHTRFHLLRAVYEGVAFSVMDCFQAFSLSFEEMKLTGGGSKSPFWCQLLADALYTKVVVPKTQELGALGVALIAGVGVGLFSNLSEAHQATFAVNRVVYPDLEAHRFYQDKFKVYRDLRVKIEDIWGVNDQLVGKISEGR